MVQYEHGVLRCLAALPDLLTHPEELKLQRGVRLKVCFNFEMFQNVFFLYNYFASAQRGKFWVHI